MLSAVDRAITLRFEWNLRRLSARCTNRIVHLPISSAAAATVLAMLLEAISTVDRPVA